MNNMHIFVHIINFLGCLQEGTQYTESLRQGVMLKPERLIYS